MISQPIVGYPTFAAFLRAADAITKQRTGLINLAAVLCAMRDFLGDNHFHKLVHDLGHGLNHALSVANIALDLVPKNDPSVNCDLLACGALLHDVYEVIDRKQHEKKGSGLAWAIVRSHPSVFTKVEPDKVADVVASHNFEPNSIEWQERSVEAKLVRDADTLEEGMNLERIVWVSVQKRRVFYNAGFSDVADDVAERLRVLGTEDRAITEAERCDALMFLLRNVTKSIDPAWFVTTNAQQYLEENSVGKHNLARLCELIKCYVRDEEQANEATALVRAVQEGWEATRSLILAKTVG